jgi:beta-lactamase regulating signal transducer with metallopeptidase domain
MLPPDFLGEPIWQRLTWTLLHFLWQGLAVAVVVSTLLYVWRLQHSRSRYLVYLSAMVMMAACPLVTFMVIEVPELATVASREVARGTPGSGRVETDVVNSASSTGLLVPAVSEGQRPLDGSERVAMAPLRFDVEETTGLAVPVASKAKLSQYVAAIQPYGLVVWIAGVLLLAARLALSWLHVRWLTRGCQKVGAELAAQAVMLGKRLGLQAPPCVCVSDKIQEAIVVGIWRPLVLLSSSTVFISCKHLKSLPLIVV